MKMKKFWRKLTPGKEKQRTRMEVVESCLEIILNIVIVIGLFAFISSSI